MAKQKRSPAPRHPHAFLCHCRCRDAAELLFASLCGRTRKHVQRVTTRKETVQCPSISWERQRQWQRNSSEKVCCLLLSRGSRRQKPQPNTSGEGGDLARLCRAKQIISLAKAGALSARSREGFCTVEPRCERLADCPDNAPNPRHEDHLLAGAESLARRDGSEPSSHRRAQRPTRPAPPRLLFALCAAGPGCPTASPRAPTVVGTSSGLGVSLLSVQQHRCAPRFPCAERGPCPESRAAEAEGRCSPCPPGCREVFISSNPLRDV